MYLLIYIVGLGLGDPDSLSGEAKTAMAQSTLVLGSQRQLLCLESLLDDDQSQQHYPTPFADVIPLLEANINHDVCLLASGDPLFYGLGDLLLRHFKPTQLHFFTNTSSLQFAFARLKKSWQYAKIISLHGRPLRSLIPHLADQQRYAVLTDQYSHPQAIAALLCEYGCENAALWVIEALGTPAENISFFKAQQLAQETQPFHSLLITVIETNETHCTLPRFAGFDDHLFFTDTNQAGKGMISKKEIRLAALSLLQPQAGEIAWDIGAGCGAIAVEWAYWNPSGILYAIEHHPKRLNCLKKNKHKFGTLNLEIIAQRAPQGLTKLPRPHAIFIGGTGGELAKIMDYCWSRLATQGCLVINCVTENCKSALLNWLQQQNLPEHQLDWTDISVSKGDILADQLVMRPRLAVRLLKITKG